MSLNAATTIPPGDTDIPTAIMVELQATVSTESANDTKENLQIEPNSLDQKEPDHKLSAHHDTAFKGDDSDGVVPWTFRSRVAALSLATLYAG